MMPAIKPSRAPASQRRRFRLAPTPSPSKLNPLTGSQVAESVRPRNRLPVVTGRAVVEIFRTVVCCAVPLIATGVMVKVAVEAVGNPESVIDTEAV